MGTKEPRLYVREMLENFQLPGQDNMDERMFTSAENATWDSGVFISFARDGFYKDIFDFWVRALNCFAENMANNLVYRSLEPFVSCQPISPEEFRENLLALVQSHRLGNMYKELGWDVSAVSCAELQKRIFGGSYRILTNHDIESSVSESNGVYLAYFHQKTQCTLLKQH
jgi:hypothetical protein